MIEKIIIGTQNAPSQERRIMYALLVANEGLDSKMRKEEAEVVCNLNLYKAYDPENQYS